MRGHGQGGQMGVGVGQKGCWRTACGIPLGQAAVLHDHHWHLCPPGPHRRSGALLTSLRGVGLSSPLLSSPCETRRATLLTSLGEVRCWGHRYVQRITFKCGHHSVRMGARTEGSGAHTAGSGARIRVSFCKRPHTGKAHTHTPHTHSKEHWRQA